MQGRRKLALCLAVLLGCYAVFCGLAMVARVDDDEEFHMVRSAARLFVLLVPASFWLAQWSRLPIENSTVNKPSQSRRLLLEAIFMGAMAWLWSFIRMQGEYSRLYDRAEYMDLIARVTGL